MKLEEEYLEVEDHIEKIYGHNSCAMNDGEKVVNTNLMWIIMKNGEKVMSSCESNRFIVCQVKVINS